VYSKIPSIIRWLLDGARDPSGRLIARWIFLRALGLIYLSAFYSLARQILGLIGPDGILPAGEYLQAIAQSAGHARFWYAPTLLWFSSGSHALMALSWVGIIASLLVVANILPRAALLICFVCFLSFVSAAGEFSGYQSDGMLLEAGFISLFVAPVGIRPGLGLGQPAMRAGVFLLLWEWFRIYFESGVVKLGSGDPQWRNFTAMDEYYQNGPLPTWIGWYVQHLPHWFHVATAFSTLALELVIVWIWFLPRTWRIVCFCIVTPWQIGVIATANYTFLNYLVLVLGFFLLDDRLLSRFVPRRIRERLLAEWENESPADATSEVFGSQSLLKQSDSHVDPAASTDVERPSLMDRGSQHSLSTQSWRRYLSSATLALTALALAWVFYSSTTLMIWMIWPGVPLPKAPVVALQPFRIADRYGLFAVMTRGRYEIEFQGSNDGQNWVPYPFRYKPQDPAKAPGIYAPYQPRFDWNLWFASLGDWRSNPMVPRTEERLLAGSRDVLALFASNPFPNQSPRQIRAVLWQYWFTSPSEKHAQGLWWKRQSLGLYAPTLQRDPNGKISVAEWPDQLEPRE
jgi:lipase maturation factor 1